MWDVYLRTTHDPRLRTVSYESEEAAEAFVAEQRANKSTVMVGLFERGIPGGIIYTRKVQVVTKHLPMEEETT